MINSSRQAYRSCLTLAIVLEFAVFQFFPKKLLLLTSLLPTQTSAAVVLPLSMWPSSTLQRYRYNIFQED